jgi:hypothetical protein
MQNEPVRYDPSLELQESDEAETAVALIEQLLKISEATYRDGGHALRSVHAKSHGVLKGELTVANGLPPALAQGLFAKAGKYPVSMRFSTSPGDILPDDVSTPRGLGIKVTGAEGEYLPGADNAQDFALVVGKAFFTSSAKSFLQSLKLLAATTDKATGTKEALSALFRGTERALEALGGESPTLKSLGGYPGTHILGESFFSQVPIRYGDYIAKIGVFPVSTELAALKDAPIDLKDENALRDAVRSFFAAQSATWEIRAQLCTDLKTMPVEDAATMWPEEESPYVTVGRIIVAPQDSWGDGARAEIDEAMAFSPWHCLTAHRPLGSIMRVRKSAYEASAGFRTERNGCPVHAQT